MKPQLFGYRSHSFYHGFRGPFGIIFGSFVYVSLPMRLATCFGHHAGSWKLGPEDGTARGLRMQMGRRA